MLRFLIRALAFVAIVLWTIGMATIALTLVEGASLFQAIDPRTGDPRIDSAIAEGLQLIEQAGLTGAAIAWLVGLTAILIVRAVLLAVIGILGALIGAGSRPPPARRPEPAPSPVPAPLPPAQPGPWARTTPPATVRDVPMPAGLASRTAKAIRPEKPARPAKAHPTALPATGRANVVERPMRLGRLLAPEAGVVLQRPRGHLGR